VPQRFPEIRFAGQLRPSQRDVIEIARQKLTAGKRRLHIVAPPGSGKTVLGLFLWAECIRRPALVLSPNSAIQAQWAARTDLFELGGPRDAIVSTNPRRPAVLTSLTYQAVTLPDRGGTDLDAVALRLWIDKLIEDDLAKDPDEADVWIEDLRKHNPDYFAQRLATYRKQARDAQTIGGDALATLHESALATLERLRAQDVGLIILDECHHLMGHWGRVLASAGQLLSSPVVVGLTATPPEREGRLPEDVQRYDRFFGPVDFEVPVPAVVKDGYLAPYQDLAYFVRPTGPELNFIAAADKQVERLVDDLSRPRTPSAPSDTALEDGVPAATVMEPEHSTIQTGDQSRPPQPDNLIAWLVSVLRQRRLPTGPVKDWASFHRRDPTLADAARLFLVSRGIALPDGVPAPSVDVAASDTLQIEILVPLIDRYVRHHLLRSSRPEDHELAERAIDRLRTLGTQITETGARPCASPVARVMAYSQSKTQALVPILRAERRLLRERIRAVVVADFEKTSAVSAEVAHLLDHEAGGAVAAFKAILGDGETDRLDPVLVTGSSVLVDDDLAERFREKCEAWLADNRCEVQLSLVEHDGFHMLVGRGADWCPRVYVQMITDLFQRGVTRCLVGTRGLLGEGWDAHKVNVLIDLTTVTTSMTVNQLRGRSIRLDPDDPAKLANNWDVVCIAPEFSKGLDDYQRFISKHKTVFGITDDGAIEKGVGHVHAAFTQLKPEGVEESVSVLNADMLQRAGHRDEVRRQWRIGEPYHAEPIRAIEAKPGAGAATFPPFRGARTAWSDHSLATAVGHAVLGALTEAGLIGASAALRSGQRAGGYVRVFLGEATQVESAAFVAALREAMGPIDRPRYVIPRHVDRISDTFLSRILPAIVGRYFRRRRRSLSMWHAVPSALGRNKDLVAIYARNWRKHVSPGEPVYALHGRGEAVLEKARRNGQVPQSAVHDKEIFL
jgi:superfamily II DNA or RNA helicase